MTEQTSDYRAAAADHIASALRERLIKALHESPNAPWLTLPGPTDLAPSFADAVLAVVAEREADLHVSLGRGVSAEGCHWCGREPAAGLVSINGRRFCHGDDDPEPTCFQMAQWNVSGSASMSADWTYEGIAARAGEDVAFQSGLRAAAAVCRAQGTDRSAPSCPSHMAAVYIENLANGGDAVSLRRTAIARRAELRRRTPIRRGLIQRAHRVRRTIDGQRRRPADTGPTPAQRRQVAERAGFCCELCGIALQSGDVWVRPHSFHHRHPRGRGGINAAQNLLLLCGTGVTGCHGKVESRRTAAYAAGWLVRTNVDPALVPVKLWWSTALLTEDGRYQEPA